MNRSLYTTPFSLDSLPGWICPTCKRGVIKPDKGTLRQYETIESRADRQNPEWERSLIRRQFSIAFVCADDSCGQILLCVGTTRIEEITPSSPDDPPGFDYADLFVPEFFSIPLNIFEIPKKCPLPVSKEIHRSFYLFFTDPSAALNHVRSAIEKLLDHYQVKHFNVVKHRLIPIKLHSRIELFQAIKPDIAKKLLAIKWIGNAGSHPTPVTKENVLDAYEILEDVLIFLFEKRDLRIRRLVAQVNKRKGPIAPRQTA